MSHFDYVSRITKNVNGNPRIIRFFPDTDLRSGHRGLRAAAIQHKIDPNELKSGQFIAFSNKKQTDMKIYAPGNVLLHVKSPLTWILILFAHVGPMGSGNSNAISSVSGFKTIESCEDAGRKAASMASGSVKKI